MHELLVNLAGHVVLWVEALGIVMVLWAVLQGLLRLSRRAWRAAAGDPAPGELGAIRLAMGERMVLGLEFFLAGDIIQTIIVPTWERLGILGGIVVIRSVIVYFLNLELSRGSGQGT